MLLSGSRISRKLAITTITSRFLTIVTRTSTTPPRESIYSGSCTRSPLTGIRLRAVNSIYGYRSRITLFPVVTSMATRIKNIRPTAATAASTSSR